MADFIQPTSLQTELISGGLDPNNPENTYVNFANTMAKNRQEQQLQEQAIARAKEIAAQSRIETSQKTTANEAGYNPELIDTMTPDQAVAALRIIMEAKGLKIDDNTIQAWHDSLPALIKREEVEAFANRFARETTRTGQPAKFEMTDNLLVPAGKSASDLGLIYFDSEGIKNSDSSNGGNSAHVPEDGMYSVIYNNQGNVVKYIPAGKESVDQTAKLAAKASDSAEKQWQKLDTTINTFIKAQRGNQITSALSRADRALNELANGEVLTPQVLNYIQKDISGIFQGGVPPQSGMEGEEFTTTYQKINALIQKYTGVSGYLHTDLGNQREYLLGLLSHLRESSIGILKALIGSEASGYKKIIEDDPERWQTMAQSKIDAVEAGLTKTAQAAAEANASPAQVTPIPGVKLPASGVNKTIPKYTVEQ